MVGQHPAASRPERVLVDLLGLLAIADHAIGLQPEAAAVVGPCGPPDDAVLARADRLAEEFYELWSRSLSFAPHAGTGSLERLLSGLLERHYQVLQVALRVGLAGDPQRRARRTAELRSAATELRRVRDELALWITARTPS